VPPSAIIELQRMSGTTDRAITIHPQVQFLRASIAAVVEELRELLYRWFILTCQERPLLLERYAALFGELEHTLQTETLRAWKAQRVCELVSLYVRRGEPITPQLLERICQFVERESRRFSDPPPQSSVPTACVADGAENPSTRTKQCVQLYRELVKKLHPDREGDPQLFALYWNVVQDAYGRGDVERLRAIYGIVCIEAHYRAGACDTLQTLERIHRRLLYRLDYEQRRLARMQHQEPFSFAALLEDPHWIAARRAQLLEAIERRRRAAELAAAELMRWGAHDWEEQLQSAKADAVRDDVFQEEFFKHAYFSMQA
jgi:hypothetical protein